MTKIIFDSDGLIKLVKAGCFRKLPDYFTCLISNEVYEETVLKGMERLYEDAFQIEELVKKKMLKVENVKNNNKAQSILENSKIGKGETSTLHLFLNTNAKVIISDDRIFLKILHQNNIPFIIPIDLIIRLYELKIISKEEATEGLIEIKPYVSKNCYDKAKAILEA
jgi:predicted nucleic acid-binding protein